MSTLDIREQVVAKCDRSYAHMFRTRVAATPDKVAFVVPSYTEPEVWRDITWQQSREQVDLLAAGLLSLGLEMEERVAIACDTRIEWVFIDMAIACAGGVTTTIYPSTKAEDERVIVLDSGSVMVVVENAEQLAKVRGDADMDAQIRNYILVTDDRVGTDADERVIPWDDLLARGERWLAGQPDGVDATIDLLRPESLSTLIYTSGTTGTPKGVELLHGAWAYEGAAIEAFDICHDDDRLFLWLPLSHVFGRDLVTACIRIGFVSIVDGRVNRLVQSVGETAPTILVGVPRIFEKVRAAVITMYPRKGVQGRISRWAFAVGRDARGYKLAGRRMPPSLGLRHSMADRLVFSKLRENLGGHMKFMVSGSAKLSPQVQEWFYSAGIVLVEGYGLTETSAIACVNHPKDFRPGTVGPALPGIEATVADDGELLLRGPIVARGYHNLPQASAEAFTDGWFHTGDIGEIDADGIVRITDRKKDLLKTSNGKYVAPQKVEAAIMANTPYAAQTLVIGEGRKFCSALLVLDQDQLASWASHHGRTDLSYAELTQLPEVRRRMDHYIRRVNSKLERWETIKKYVILDHELSLEAGELTPSLKIRRNIVMAKYAGLIDQIYDDDSPFEFVPPEPEHHHDRHLDGADGAEPVVEEAADRVLEDAAVA